ncbi:hypothetical protein BOTBODRAFT_32595 [Botryobasidium botryosum FD-172 SS1]|uniref:FAD-binding PCMH-type domain-containing protein n=1 Tax=Botryobasidium botryosum (strain FD-172 SS1) TaxID=930990 RepID=A0A067MG32_BOTB1|nr:hypothetical protein BOTBODRAFT_32595 [Botryobasidium botryosum FD-172 SS1]
MRSSALQALFATTCTIGPRVLPCAEGDECWPSMTAWAQLNNTLSGRLVRSLPPAAPCHVPYYDAAACDAARGNWTDPFWRSRQTGGYQDTAWENGDEACHIDGPKDMPCKQGLVPYYTAVVENVEDVQAAVNFARENSVKTRIKGASHDFLGKSSGRGAFGIHTIKLKGITFDDNFVPASCNVASQGAVTVASGEHFIDVYKAADEHGCTVVGGSSTSVGGAGGWILGGGHSFMSPVYGLGVDNVLQFTVVTADGQTRIANECQNSDLFWALRGGGGGFAITISATYKTHPAVNNISFVAFGVVANESSHTPFLATLLSLLPAFDDKGITGYVYASQTKTDVIFMKTDSDDVASVNATLAPIYDLVRQSGNDLEVTHPATGVAPSIYSLFSGGFGAAPEGVAAVLGSRLFPRSVFEDEEKIGNMSQFLGSSGVMTILCLVGGGKVNKPAADVVAVNPSWRKALTHVVVADLWPSSSTTSERNVVRSKITRITQRLAEFAGPDMGAYINEADVNEPDWQRVFWGSNYDRLLRIKNIYDPTGILTCQKCVGDESGGAD